MGGNIKKSKNNVQRVAQQIGISTSTAWKICHDDLSLPYKMQLSQPLSEDRIMSYYAFVKEYEAGLEEIWGVLNVTCFSNGEHFHLDGYTNKQNIQFWASENPRLTTSNPFQSVIVQCALSRVRICTPMFFDDTFTVVYCSLLSDEFFPFPDGI
jgi:hypothetical protein